MMCVLNVFIADRVTYCQSHTFAQPLANPVDPVLTAFDWILAYYTVLASQLEAVFVWQSSLAECQVKASSNTKERVGE